MTVTTSWRSAERPKVVIILHSRQVIARCDAIIAHNSPYAMSATRPTPIAVGRGWLAVAVGQNAPMPIGASQPHLRHQLHRRALSDHLASLFYSLSPSSPFYFARFGSFRLDDSTVGFIYGYSLLPSIAGCVYTSCSAPIVIRLQQNHRPFEPRSVHSDRRENYHPDHANAKFLSNSS